MSQVVSSWDAMCTVLLENRDHFQLSVDPKDDELANIIKIYDNGCVQKLVSEWLTKLTVAKVGTTEVKSSCSGSFESKSELERYSHRDVTVERTSQTKERFVVTTEDLAESAAIIYEEAFVAAPVYGEGYVPGKSRPICSQCLSMDTRSELTCAKCKRVSYCGDACLAAASSKNIHQFQCKGHLMGIFHDLGISHLAVNAMLTGIDSISELFGNVDDVELWSSVTQTSNEAPSKNGYFNVLRLGTNFDHTSADDYLRFALTATMFTFYLRDHTDFRFVQSEHIVAALLLRHLGQIVNNAHTMYGIVIKATKEDSFNVQLGQLHDRARVDVIATGLFPRIAILNHSCDPNIRNYFSRNTLTIHATRPIAKNEEVFNGYCPSYKLLDGPERRQLLREQYGFECDCPKCTPQSEVDLLEQYQTYVCQSVDCGRPIVPDVKQSKWWREGDAPVHPLVCKNCKVALDLGWSDQFMSLFERDVASVQQLKWLAHDICEAYTEGCLRFAGHHMQKWDMASMVLKLLPIAQIEFDTTDRTLLESLVNIASDYAEGIGQQFGNHSLEYIEASAYWLDMLARQKATIGCIDSGDKLHALRALIKEMVSEDVLPIYEEYFNNYLL